jgi:putative transposase
VAVFPSASGRAAAMPRLLDLDSRGELGAAHVRLVAQALGKSERTVWRWLAAAREDHRLARVESSHFTVTTEVRRLLALWGGNASRVHAELVQRAADDPDAPAVPSLSTLHRAIRRDLTRGERAGLRSGEAARRAHDVFGQRPTTHRNTAWEGDHKHVPVEVDVDVDVDGELATPWVTWFIDCATKAITGVAVTAHAPSRDAVLASLRIAITRSDPFGPVGGLPGQIRVDRGKEFLSATVTAAMGALAVPVTDLPAYTPHLKGTIEALNDAVEEMFLLSLPRYTGRQKLNRGHLADPDAPPLTYEAFVGLLLDWVTWWNTRHHPSALNGKTPVQAWQADATPLVDVSVGQLATFALEDNGRTYTISTSGVRWRRRDYLAPWMNGRTGTKVSVRHLPHHDDTIEVFDTTGRHLGSAFLAAAASREQIRSVQAARTAAARRLKADLKAAEKLRRRRFEASTTATPPRALGSPTSAQAEEELGAAAQTDRRALAVPISFRTAPRPTPGPAPGPRAHLPLMRTPADDR